MRPKFTIREAAFILHYRGKARGNGTKAAILAGYAPGPSAHVTASRLLRKATIKAALKAAMMREERIEKADAEERDQICSAFARDLFGDKLVRLAAIKELNKVDGRHTIRHQIEGKATLEMVLAASREGED